VIVCVGCTYGFYSLACITIVFAYIPLIRDLNARIDPAQVCGRTTSSKLLEMTNDQVGFHCQPQEGTTTDFLSSIFASLLQKSCPNYRFHYLHDYGVFMSRRVLDRQQGRKTSAEAIERVNNSEHATRRTRLEFVVKANINVVAIRCGDVDGGRARAPCSSQVNVEPFYLTNIVFSGSVPKYVPQFYLSPGCNNSCVDCWSRRW
jgi:hypothetical protein